MAETAFPVVPIILWDCDRQEFHAGLMSQDSATGEARFLGFLPVNALRVAVNLADIATMLLEMSRDNLAETQRHEKIDDAMPYKREMEWGDRSVIIWSPVPLSVLDEG
jgi:hypothetical protein